MSVVTPRRAGKAISALGMFAGLALLLIGSVMAAELTLEQTGEPLMWGLFSAAGGTLMIACMFAALATSGGSR